MALAAPDRQRARLDYLTALLDGLPDSLPNPGLDSEPTYYIDLVPPFIIDQAHIHRCNGNEVEALCWVLNCAFVSDDEWQIIERGEGIGAVVGVLELYLKKYPNQFRILVWIDKFVNALEAFYRERKLQLPPEFRNAQPSEQNTVNVDTSAKRGLKRKAASTASGDEGLEAIPSSDKVGSFLKGKAAAVEETDEVAGHERDTSIVFGPDARMDKLRNKYPVKMKSNGNGRPPNEIITKLSIRLWDKVKGSAFWACRGVLDGCTYIQSGYPQKNRVAPHAAECRFLNDDLRNLVSDYAAAASLGAKLEGSTSDEVSTSTKVGSGPSTSEPAAKKIKLSQTSLDHDFTKRGQEQQQDKINHCIVKLICVNGLVPNILDSDEWKEFMKTANPKYRHTPSDKFEHEFIPNEAKHVEKKVLQILRSEKNLTLSFDGNTTRKPQSIYTVHATTKDRDSYFLKGIEGSNQHHTANWVSDRLSEVVDEIGEANVSLICSDSTGNTRVGRRQVNEKYPSILDTGDCVHHVHLTIKDITKLSEFKEMLALLKKTNAYFGRSTFSSTVLRDARETAEVPGGGLIKIGKTRFGTHWTSAVGLRRCFPFIKDLVSSGQAKPKDKGVRELFESRVGLRKFEGDMDIYIEIISPLARSLWSLESPETNAADVFIFWLAITSTLKELFAKSSHVTGISESLKRKVTAIVNQRYKAFIDQSPSDIYFTAFFLDPRYARLGILKKPTNMSYGIVIPARPTDKKPTVNGGPVPGSSTEKTQGAAQNESVPYPNAYKRVKVFLKDVLMKEVEMVRRHPDKTKEDILHKYTTPQIAERFVRQLGMYARNEWPFDLPHENNALSWWQSLEKHPQADILARLAIKIYSCLVNSMADERTGSKITWFNSAFRSNQTVRTLTYMCQIGQWYGVHMKKDRRKARRPPTVGFRDMSKELTNPEPPSSNSDNSKTQKPRATTLYSDDEQDEDLEADDDLDSEIDDVEVEQGGQRDEEADEFEVDEDINLDATVLGTVIDGGIGKLAAQASATASTASHAVENDEDFDWASI